MTDMHLTVKLSFEDLLKIIDRLTPSQRLIVRGRLDHPWVVEPEALRALYETFSPVREAAADMTDEEVNAAIDAAIAEVRRGE